MAWAGCCQLLSEPGQKEAGAGQLLQLLGFLEEPGETRYPPFYALFLL